jgi:hypothetical protein
MRDLGELVALEHRRTALRVVAPFGAVVGADVGPELAGARQRTDAGEHRLHAAARVAPQVDDAAAQRAVVELAEQLVHRVVVVRGLGAADARQFEVADVAVEPASRRCQILVEGRERNLHLAWFSGAGANGEFSGAVLPSWR